MEFLIQPVDCVHINNIKIKINSFISAIRKHSCSKCKETSEIWICLSCSYVGCSRFCYGHSKSHYERNHHPIVFNQKTMSFWCYECDNYVMNDTLKILYEIALEDYEMNSKLYKPYFSTYNEEGVIKYIKENNIHKIIVLAGAGMSTSAGIPDFRSPGTGLYFNLQKYNLPYPEAVFDMDYFPHNPAPFYEIMKEMFPGKGKYFPTKTHYFIKLLNDHNMLKRIYTQNIDGLEMVAGIPEEKIVHSHGTFQTAKCLNCKTNYMPLGDDCVVGTTIMDFCEETHTNKFGCKKCIKGYTPTLHGLCVKCDHIFGPDCVECDPTNSEKCTQCKSGAIITREGACIFCKNTLDNVQNVMV